LTIDDIEEELEILGGKRLSSNQRNDNAQSQKMWAIKRDLKYGNI